MRINGTETISQSGGTSYGSQNVLLFKTNMGYGSYKLYYFKIYRGEDIVRNYIPCYRNYDGAAGLYDLVSNKFFGNTTAEDFSTRETVVRAVPNEYWQVEYIESTSKQAIALPEDLDCDWFELDCEFTSSEREMCLLGNREAVATWELFTQPDVPNFYLWIRDVGTTATGASALERSTVSYDYTTSMLIVNEQTVFAKKIPTMPRNLFQCGDGSYLSDARLYGAKFKKSGALVLDLVPCVRKSDFEAGLFDLVNKVFYTNNRGGNFVSGGVISQSGNALNKLRSEYDTQEYLTSSGGQYIDTGIVPASDLKLEVTFGADDITMSNGYLLGNGEGGLEIYLENGSWQVAFGSEKVSGSAIPATKTTICLSGKTLSASWDNNPLTVIAQFTSDLQSSRALTLFATNREGGLLLSDGIFICKFLAENGGAVTDLTPAARVEDGALGMFDLVGDAFSESDGTAFLPKQTILERKLPAGYRLLEYLEGTGTQYIDTGIIDAAGVMYELDAFTASWTSVIGTANGVGVTHSETYPGGSFNYCGVSGVGGTLTNKRTVFKQNNNYCYKNGAFVGAFNYATSSNAQTIYLFGKNQNGQLADAGNSKIFGCKIYENNLLARYFIPCVREANGEVGLYDTVTGSFFQNQGTGKFYSNETESAYNGVVLPSGYKQVEYIQGTGTQHILSDVVVSKGDKLVFEAKIKFDTTANIWNGANYFLQYNYKYFSTEEVLKFKIVYEDGFERIYVGDELMKAEDWTLLEEKSLRLCFFALGTNEENAYFKNGAQSGRLYYAKLTKNEKVVLECVPCYRESDGKAGLYNLVTGAFLQNAGEGEFLTGMEVNNLPAAYERVEYIEYAGTQNLEIPCALTPTDSVEVILSDGGEPSRFLLNTASGQVNAVNGVRLGATASGITLFGSSQAVRIYGIRVNGEKGILEDYLPCCEKYNGKVGLFEQVNGVFLPGAAGAATCNVRFEPSKVNDIYDTIQYVRMDGEHFLDLACEGNVFYTFDCGAAKGSARIVITEEHGASSVVRRVNGEVTTTLPIAATKGIYRISGAWNGASFDGVLTLYGVKAEQGGKVVSDFVPVRRKSDRSIGFLDKVTNVFYVVYDNKDGFTAGNVVGHNFTENRVLSEASERQEGEVVHVCAICGMEIHEHVAAHAYKVTFACGVGVKEIKVFKGYDLGEYEVTNVAYSRNEFTNNYSRTGGQVFFEVVFEEGYELEKFYVEGAVPEKRDGKVYCLTSIEKDTTVNVLAKKAVANG